MSSFWNSYEKKLEYVDSTMSPITNIVAIQQVEKSMYEKLQEQIKSLENEYKREIIDMKKNYGLDENRESHIIKCQAIIRGFLIRNRFKLLSKQVLSESEWKSLTKQDWESINKDEQFNETDDTEQFNETDDTEYYIIVARTNACVDDVKIFKKAIDVRQYLIYKGFKKIENLDSTFQNNLVQYRNINTCSYIGIYKSKSTTFSKLDLDKDTIKHVDTEFNKVLAKSNSDDAILLI